MKLCKEIDAWDGIKASDGKGLMKDRLYDYLAATLEKRIKEGKSMREAVTDCFEGSLRTGAEESVRKRQEHLQREQGVCIAACPRPAYGGESGLCMHWNEHIDPKKFNTKVLVGAHQFCDQHWKDGSYSNNTCRCCDKMQALFKQKFCYYCRHRVNYGKEKWVDLYVPAIAEPKKQELSDVEKLDGKMICARNPDVMRIGDKTYIWWVLHSDDPRREADRDKEMAFFRDLDSLTGDDSYPNISHYIPTHYLEKERQLKRFEGWTYSHTNEDGEFYTKPKSP